jgi:hypothetical protein
MVVLRLNGRQESWTARVACQWTDLVIPPSTRLGLDTAPWASLGFMVVTVFKDLSLTVIVYRVFCEVMNNSEKD